MRIDLHVHTVYSHQAIFFYDGVDTPETVVKVARKKGLDGVAITDHDTLAGVERARVEGKKRGIVVLEGCEITTNMGHILAYGITEGIPPNLTPEETIEMIRDQGGVSVIAHPFSGFGTSLGLYSKRLKPDGIEVWNSSLLALWQNILAEKLAEHMGVTKTAGSDAHMADHVGKGVVYVEGDDPEDILDGLARGNVRILRRSSVNLFELSEWLRRRAEINREYTSIYFSRRRKTKPLSIFYRILLRAPRIMDILYLPPAYLIKYMLNRSGKKFIRNEDFLYT